jgi:hypothetical protein
MSGESPGTRLRRFRPADGPVFLAMLLLCALLVWKLWVAVLLPTPPRASLLASAAGDSAGYLLLIGEPSDTAAARRLAPARGAAPGQPPLSLRTVSWASEDAAAAPVVLLVRSLGYTAPPVLLTVDGDGHIVRVQPVPSANAYAHAARGGTR